MATTLASQVQELYIGYLGRAADKAGLDFWVKAIENGTSTLESVALGFTLSAEYKAAYEGLTTTQLVAKVYQNVLGRVADADGLGFWVGEINKGVVKADTLVKSMINSLGAIDQLNMDNKVQAANTYTTTAGDKYDLAAAKAAIGASTSNNPGQTFTLTAAVDNVVGTTGNDTIIGGAATAGNGSTLGSADVIDGGAGTDTLKITLDGVGATPNMKNVEILSVQNLTGLQTVNMINAVGVQQIVNDRSTAALTVNNVQELAAVAVNGLSNAAQAYTVSFKDSLVTGTADAVSVTLDASTMGTLTVAGQGAGGFETVNLTAKAGRSDVAVLESNFAANSGTQTINIDGAGSVRLRDIAGTVTKVDASTNTGGVDVHIDTVATAGANRVVTFTGGAGDDQIRMEDTLTAQDVIDGGAGRDTIHVTNGAHLVQGLQVKNVEQLDIAVGQGTYNMDRLAGIDTLVVSNSLNALGAIVDNLAKGAKIVLGGENTAADLIGGNDLTVNVKDSGAGSANDVIDITVNSRTGVTTAAGSDLNIANVETVNIKASSAAAEVTHNFAGAVNLTHALTINVTADTAALTLGNLQALALVDFNASASTKAVSITTGNDNFSAAAGTAFKLGAGNDTLNLTGAVGGNLANDADATKGYDFVITGGKGGDAITLAVSAAANKDLLVFAAGDSLAGQTGANNNFDTVTNFGTTFDKIDLKAFGFSGSDISALKAGTAASINTANGLVNANAATSFFGAGADHRAVVTIDDGANTWVYVDTNKDGNFQADTDLAIQFVGLTGGTVPVLADFVFA